MTKMVENTGRMIELNSTESRSFQRCSS